MSSRGLLVIVDPAYASTVGHHGEVNRPLLAELIGAGWRAELWADVALEAEPTAPSPLRGVFSDCGYGDPAHWRELGGMVRLARRLEGQLVQAAAWAGEPVAAWLGHSLLPFQLLGLARHLATAAPAEVLLSLMFSPGETLKDPGGTEQATANARVALAALARACRQQGHRLTLAFPSRQQERLYEPLLAATGVNSAGVHSAVVGAGCRPQPPRPGEPPLVLLHWGDLKPGKGRGEALAVLEQLLAGGARDELHGWGWLWHQHGTTSLPSEERQLLKEAQEAGLGLVCLEQEVPSAAMQQWLARCPLALLAYDPLHYSQRSSGLLWHWAASRYALGKGALAVGYGEGWLAAEAQELGLNWRVPAGGWGGDAWLGELAGGAEAVRHFQGINLNAAGQAILGTCFATWCSQQLARNSGSTLR
ncbi:MAG: hypothetical protein QUV06_09905 [Cyanobium sp. CZS 48M]|nr:hypothetical protein [Cyanobium sp. CZS48M]